MAALLPHTEGAKLTQTPGTWRTSSPGRRRPLGGIDILVNNAGRALRPSWCLLRRSAGTDRRSRGPRWPNSHPTPRPCYTTLTYSTAGDGIRHSRAACGKIGISQIPRAGLDWLKAKRDVVRR